MIAEPHCYISVHLFLEEYKLIKDIPIASTATVWTDDDNQSYLLVFHEALFFGTRMSSLLLCLNQLHANGLTVQDVPKQFDQSKQDAM